MPPRADTLCFGKLPIAGDFVRGDLVAREMPELDRWIQEGMHRSQTLLGNTWTARFDALPPSHFVWTPQAQGAVIAGCWFASRDAAGRRYPFLLAVRISEIGADELPLLPLALEGFWAAAAARWTAGWQGLEVPGVVRKVQEIVPVIDFAAARARLTTAVRTPDGGPRIAAVDRAVLWSDIDAMARTSPPPRFGLRWPLQGDQLAAACWLGVLAHAGMPRPRLVLWTDATGATAGSMRVAVDRLDARTFPGLVFPALDDDDVYDLGRQQGDAARVAEAERRFGALTRTDRLDQALTALQQERR